MQVVIAPAVQFPLSLSLLHNLFSEPMHVCTLAHVRTLQRLAIWSTFWLSTTFLFFSEPMQVVIAPAVQFPMDLCSASATQPISFLFVVSQNSSIPKENCKSQIPDSLSCFSLWATRKRTNYTTALLPLSGSSAKLQCCKSRETPCQPSGSTRCPLKMAQGSQRKPSRVD